MRKRIMVVTLFVAFAVITGMNVYNAQKSDVELSGLALENVEALAHDENGFGCDNGCVSNGNGCECHGWHDNLAEYHGN